MLASLVSTGCWLQSFSDSGKAGQLRVVDLNSISRVGASKSEKDFFSLKIGEYPGQITELLIINDGKVYTETQNKMKSLYLLQGQGMMEIDSGVLPIQKGQYIQFPDYQKISLASMRKIVALIAYSNK
ncbi:MAG: hypothetical protein KDK39_09515 [Leptospiraceae bacterium]|nr:hypothetical protein [Leptospiraceae bacterium]